MRSEERLREVATAGNLAFQRLGQQPQLMAGPSQTGLQAVSATHPSGAPLTEQSGRTQPSLSVGVRQAGFVGDHVAVTQSATLAPPFAATLGVPATAVPARPSTMIGMASQLQ